MAVPPRGLLMWHVHAGALSGLSRWRAGQQQGSRAGWSLGSLTLEAPAGTHPPPPPKEERILRPGDLCQPCGHPHPGLTGVRAPPLHPLQHENFITNLFGLDFDRGLAKRPFLSFFPRYSINTFSLKKSGVIW